MALGSQSTKLDTTTTQSGLLHAMFVDGVINHYRSESITSQVFQEAGPGDYELKGTALYGAALLNRAPPAMSTPTGMLPDHAAPNPQNWNTTPVRRHKRVAVDNMMAQRGMSPGAYQDLIPYLFDLFWDGWKDMEIRQSIGGSDGYVCLVSSRSDSNTVVLKDAYGHTDTTPMLFLDVGMPIAWLDANNSYVVGGAGVISAATFPNTIDITSAATWEPGAATPAAGDPIVFCTTGDTTADYFETEYNAAPNGLKTLIDPDDALTTVEGISEDTYPLWAPWREASSTFDHIELTEHWRKLAHKSMSPVTAETHIAITSGAVMSELARSLEGFQMQTQLGQTFEGGYQAVRIAGRDIAEDTFFFHNVLCTISKEDVFRIPLGAGAGMSSEDGSEWSRLPDQDAREAYGSEYMQYFTPRRRRHAALTGISVTNVDADDFSPVPLT
jgi:hypothetical protein